MGNIVAGDKVLLEFSTFGDRFVSIVTDVKEDGTLFAHAPITQPIIDRLRTDTFVFIRFAYEGKLRGYNSRVMNKVESESTVLQLMPPHDVIDAEERSEPRCACHFPAIVVDGDKAAQAVVEDMSVSCSRVRLLNGGLMEDEAINDVRLTFHPFDQGSGYSIHCFVQNSFLKNGERYAVLQFHENDVDTRKRIAQFVEGQICCGIPRI